MVTQVADIRSNAQEQIGNAARAIRGSEIRRLVFAAVVRGKQKSKSVQEISRATKLTRKQVLTAGKFLSDHDLVTQTKKDKGTAYEKVPLLAQNRRKVLTLAANPEKLATFATRSTPVMTVVRIAVPQRLVKIKTVTADDIDSFRLIKRIRGPQPPTRMLEATFKKGVAKLLGESGRFSDWGGEKGDLFTTRLRMGGKRFGAAFAFKGRGRSGELTPALLGKNGDQIQRLFTNDAEVFFVQYWDRIAESVLTQMSAAAIAKSYATGKRIYYGIIDGSDSSRLIAAYPSAF
jgi:hypothetical protein